MASWKQSKFYYPFLIIVPLILAMIFYSGIVLTEDITGRIIIGSVWLLVSAGWLRQYFNNKVEPTE